MRINVSLLALPVLAFPAPIGAAAARLDTRGGACRTGSTADLAEGLKAALAATAQ
jgi:hypothetical protein